MKLRDTVPAAERRFGYLSDLSTLVLAEDQNTSWLHAAPVGAEYKHPLYGRIKFTLEKIQRFAQNIKNGVRGIDIAIDYAHRSEGPAAGWVRDAEIRATGLWLLVEWTVDAAESIRKKEFRYFSPEFVDEYKDSKTGQVFKDVLLGGGLTNRPFLKDLLPVNLSEVFTEEESEQSEKQDNKEEESVNEFLKKLQKQLGLPESATEDQILAAMASKGGDSQTMSELVTQNRQLSEQLATLVATQRLSEAIYQLKEWSRGDKFVLPPAVHEDVKALLLEAPSKQFQDKLVGVVDTLLKTGLVPMDEKGSARTSSSSDEDKKSEEGDATKRFNDLVESILKDNKDMGVGDAIEEAARRDERLFSEYRKQSYSFEERP